MPRRRARRQRLGGPRLGFAAEGLEGRVLLSTFTVTSLADDGSPGTLRAAIGQANANPGDDTIIFAATVQSTITLTQGQLELGDTTGSISIDGPGASILSVSGGGKSRVFQVDANVTAQINGLTITGGHALDGADGMPGAQLPSGPGTNGGDGQPGGDGGAILSMGVLTVKDCVVADNKAGAGGTGGQGGIARQDIHFQYPSGAGGSAGRAGDGGGIYSGSALILIDDTIRDNIAGAGGGGGADPDGPFMSQPGASGGDGGGIYCGGPMMIVGSTIDGNVAGRGGAPPNPVYAGNVAGGSGGSGGGIFALEEMQVVASTISNNTAGAGSVRSPGGDGGGIYGAAVLQLSNDTIAKNVAGSGGTQLPGPSEGNGGSGGGIFSLQELHGHNLTIDSNRTGAAGMTIAGATSTAGAGGGIWSGQNAGSALGNTIIAGNAADGGGPDIYSPSVSSEGHNLIGIVDGSGGWGSSDSTGTASNPQNPKLSPLGNYGGPMMTMPPLPGSPAIDAGANSLAVGPDGKPLTTDQRGLARIVDYTFSGTSTVDIGAVELQRPAPFPLIVTTTVDELDSSYGPGNLSLREAVVLANANPGPDTITFGNGVGGTIQLTKGPLAVTDTTGATSLVAQTTLGLAIDGNGGRALTIASGASASISGITLTGGGIDNAGTLALTGCTVSGNNAASDGGGIRNTGTLTVTNSTIANNSVPSTATGGGIFNSGTATLTNVTVSNNSALGSTAGGIDNTGALTLGNTVVAGNHAQADPDLVGPVTSQGHNLIGVADGATGLAASDLSGTAAAPLDAKLAVLDDYSGLELTMPPLVGSPLIDAGDNALASGISTDERGLPRVAGAAVDIGADESQAVPLVVPGIGDSGPGRGLSLRSAVNLAQVAPTASPITFGPRANGLLKLARGPLVIRTGAPVIVGPGSFDLTIDGVSTRAITVNAGASLTVSGLTLTGHSTDSGGAVGNFGTLALSDCTLTGGISPAGGALFNFGTLTIDNSTLMGNDTPGGGRGGAIYNDVSGMAVLTNDTISGNAAFSGAGGGIYNAGKLTVSMTTFSGNSSSGGGGLYDTGNLPALSTNCTFSANTVAGTNAAGGAVYGDGTLSLVNCTITGNTAGGGLGGGVLSGGQLKIGNTIIAGNTAGAGPDVSGPIKSLGHNLVGISNGGGGFIASDRSGTTAAPLDPKLAPLGDYGGATRTIPPLAGSPAIDGGDNSLASTLATDQRGLARVSGAAVDVGAVEFPQDPLVVNTADDYVTLAGQLSLRQAINLINAGATGSNHVRFALDQPAFIQLLPSEPLLITAPAVIEGPGAAALHVGSSGNDASIVIQASPVSISGLFLGGRTALRVDSGGGVELSNVSTGGDFAVSGTATLDGALQLKSLNIFGGSVRLKDAASPAALDLTGLGIDSGARLDVGDGIVRIHSTASGLADRIAGYLATGSAQGAWNGPGIDSSAAAANKSYGVGYADEGTGILTIRYTLLGDANLDGRVGFADLLALAQHYLQTGTSWPQGDFNYDGSAGFDDLLLVAQNYGKSVVSARRQARH